MGFKSIRTSRAFPNNPLTLPNRHLILSSIPVDMDQSANSGQSRAVKVSLMSLFFNPGRDLHEGLQSLEDAQNLLEEVKARLDPSVKKDFEHRLHG
jgi:hypothetical protein